MVPQVNTDDLIDATGVADVIGLSQRTSVSVYQRRYPEMPRPVVDLGRGRPRLWLRSEITAWAKVRGRRE
jgi:glutathione-regulated potassium-efflux system ancillary protein KefG